MKRLSGIRAVGAAMVLGGVAATATAAWQPGLWGGFHTRGASDFTSPPIYTNVFPDTHCATNWNGGTSNTDSPDIIWSNDRVWSYWGQIYLPATNVTFGQAIDDKAILYIDGLKILNQVAANCVRTTVTTNYTTAGWHDFMFQASNGAGGAGPMSSGNGLGDGIGFGVKFGDDTAWSYMADDGNMSRYRHDDGLGFDDTFRVTGVPSNFGAPVPFYGTYAGVANGSNLTMSVASGSGYVTASDTQRACCTGYVWYAVDSVSSTKTVVQGGADTSFAYSHNNMAEIAWHWKVENLVTVTAGTGGSVSTNGGWLDAGATIEVTAIDGDGFFLCWLGDIDEAQRTSRTITITADQARTVTAHFGNEIFVATNGNDTASGTSADPVATLAAALSLCGDDGIVTFTPGIYTISSETTLATGVTVRGETDNPDDVILKCNGKYRHFKLAHADARLSGLTLTDGKPAAGHGGTVLITQAGGMVSNCVMRNSAPEAWGTEGGGFYIEKNAATALVTDCIVSNCCCSTAGNGFDNAYGGGIAAYMAAGTVRNCLFVKNGTTALCSNKGGAVHITGGTLANCTVTGTFYQSGTGVRADGGTVINCLIGANDTGSDRSGHDAIWIGNANCFTNCLAESAINEWCSGAIRLFANVAAGDYRPAAAAVDAGVPLDWMDGAADLAGNARIIGTAPDIGCHERDQSLFDVSTAPSALAGFAPLTVDFEVTTWGVGAAGITCQWDWDGDGVYDETTTGSTSHTFTTCGDFPVSVKVTDVATDTVREDHGIGTIRVRPRVLYVDAQSADPVAPYGDAAHAARNVADALDIAISGSSVEIAEGTYDIPVQLELTEGVVVRGATGNPEDVILKMKGSNHRIAFLDHAEARIENVAMQGGNIANNTSIYTKNGGGVFIGAQGGTLSNCIVRACRTWVWGNEGDGIYIQSGATAALVTHCVISNCVSDTSSEGDSGNAVTMYDGTVRNCLITGNSVIANNSTVKHAYGTVRIGGGRIENCTIAKNRSFNCSGIHATGGTVVNCLIGANESDFRSANTNYAVWAGTANCFTNCIAPITINAWCLTEIEPLLFMNAAGGDFMLPGSSAAVDAGATLGWMTGATDLAGNTRIHGAAPDIGAYEADSEAFSPSFYTTVNEGFPPFTTTFTVTPANAQGPVTCAWDLDGDGVQDGAATSGTTATHTFAAAGIYPVGLTVSDGASSYVVPYPVTIRVIPRVLHVAAASQNAAFPYDTPSNAASNIQDAVDTAIDGCEIVVAAGDYPLRQPISVTKSVRIRGATGNPDDVVVRNSVKKALDETTTCRVFVLNAEGAMVSGVTIADGTIENNTTTFSKNGGGIFIGQRGGVVSNCVVRNCSTWMWGNYAGGIYIDKDADTALVTHCIITNCQNATAQNQNNLGAALYMCAGTVRNSLFAYNNPPKANTTDPIWTAYAEGGSIENCTFTANDSPRASGVYASQNADIVNCLVVGNTTALDSATHPDYIGCGGTAASYFRCLSETAVNADCFAAPAGAVFKDFEAGDFRLHRLSPAVSRGTPLAWATSTATDLAGKPRLSGRLDLGAYECHGAGVMIIVR